MTIPDTWGHVDDLPWISSPEAVADLPETTESILVRGLNDEIAGALGRLPLLRTLYQDGNSEISDKGLEALGRLARLEQLDLEWSSKITDDGLLHLISLRHLAFLDVGFCERLTERGVKEFQKRLPSCSIYGVAA